MYSELKHNLQVLFQEHNRLSKKDINGVDVTGWWNLNVIKLFIGVSSILIVVVKGGGFSSGFLDFVTSYLSILIGLFITALIFSFDKFYEVKDTDEAEMIKNNAKLRIWDAQTYNYTKKFAFMTSQTIVISVFVLLIVALENLFPSLSNYNIRNYQLLNYKEWNFEAIKLFVTGSVATVFRFLTIYWLLTIMTNTLYIVSGMVDYMIKKNDRVTK